MSFIKDSHNLSMGIVGLPNVGKSTLFNMLTSSDVAVANYPFCTINPSEGVLPINDHRLDELSKIYKPKVVTPAYLQLVDIAGLVKGASKGEGLGNSFLDHIRRVDGIFHVVRCFPDTSILRVDDISPITDIDIINNELRLKDIQLIDSKLSGKKTDKVEKLILIKLRDILVKDYNDKDCENKDRNSRDIDNANIDKDGKDAINAKDTISKESDINTNNIKNSNINEMINKFNWSKDEINYITSLNLLSTKNVVYIANIGEDEYNFIKSRKKSEKKLHFKYLREIQHLNPIIYCKSNITKEIVVKRGYEALGLINFFTAGKTEVRSWTIKGGTHVNKAGAVIHSDFSDYFISSDVIEYEDLINFGSDAEVKKAGRLYSRGKGYLVKDADIILFKANPSSSKKK